MVLLVQRSVPNEHGESFDRQHQSTVQTLFKQPQTQTVTQVGGCLWLTYVPWWLRSRGVFKKVFKQSWTPDTPNEVDSISWCSGQLSSGDGQSDGLRSPVKPLNPTPLTNPDRPIWTDLTVRRRSSNQSFRPMVRQWPGGIGPKKISRNFFLNQRKGL